MHAYLLRYGTKIYWRLRLAKNRVKVNVPLRVRRNIPYHGHLRKSHRLDIYRPLHTTGPLPVVVHVHGGGWIMGSKFEMRDLARELAAQNLVVVTINYRLSPEHRFPAGAIDGLRAMEWVKKHIARYGGDPETIYLSGDSSGAHIAACMAAAATSQKLRDGWGVTFNVTTRAKKLVLYYGVYKISHDKKVLQRKYFKTYAKAYLGTLDMTKYKLVDYVSPIDYVNPDFPKTMLLTGEVDPLCSQSVDFATALSKVDGEVKLLLLKKSEYPNAVHGFLADAGTPHARLAFATVCDFLHES